MIRKTKKAKQDKQKAKLVEVAFEEETPLPEAVPDYTRELEIIDCRKVIPRHKTLRWGRRSLDKVMFIVIHHTATPLERSSFTAIANYCITPSDKNHLSKDGAPSIPYHFGIDGSVGVSQFNDLEDVTWGAKGYNTRSIHVSCLGDFSTGGTHTGADVVPSSYIEFYLPELLKRLKKQFPNAKVVTHRDLGKYACPGDVLYTWVKGWN